ncbi:hypothetical protein FRB98_007612 [Tulasnella sp. 332]|nr:hypothetical protein FRB98_007612 [Tulasnella sp. 332]
MPPARKLLKTTTTTSSRAKKEASVTSQSTIDNYFAKPSAPHSKLQKENIRETQGSTKRKRTLDDPTSSDARTSSVNLVEKVRPGKILEERSNHRPPLSEVPSGMGITSADAQSVHAKRITSPSTRLEPQMATPRLSHAPQRINSSEMISSSQELSQYTLLPTHNLRFSSRLQGDRPIMTPRLFHTLQFPSDEIIPDSQASSPERGTQCRHSRGPYQDNTRIEEIISIDNDRVSISSPSGHVLDPVEDEEIVPSSQTQLMASAYPQFFPHASPCALTDLDLPAITTNPSERDHFPGIGSPTQEESYAPWVKDLLTRVGNDQEKTGIWSRQDADVADETENMSSDHNIGDVVLSAEEGGTASAMKSEDFWQDHHSLNPSASSKRSVFGSSHSASLSIAPSLPSTPRFISTRTSSYPPSALQETPTSQFSFDVSRILPSQYTALPDAASFTLPNESFFNGLARCLRDDPDSD